MTLPLVPFAGRTWRGHDPRWAHDPLSGQGAAITGGRFNPKGRPALYLALSPETAIREIQAGFANRFQPMTLCAYDVQADAIADLRNEAIISAMGLPVSSPSCDWRFDLSEGRTSASHELAERLRSTGAQGALAPSFAIGAAPHELSLVLWTWNTAGGAHVALIDDHGRLMRR